MSDPITIEITPAPPIEIEISAGGATDAFIAAKIGQSGSATDLALKATYAPVSLDGEVVKKTGAQTIAGVKTFSSPPVVPGASFGIAATSGLQTALDAKSALPAQRTSDIASMQSEHAVTPQQFGAKGDGITDDTTAIANCMASGATSVFFPPGIYLTTATVIQPATMNVAGALGAIIKASASMSVLYQVGTVSTSCRKKFLHGIILDANNLATVPLLMMSFERFVTSDVQVYNSGGDAIVVGDPSTAGVPFEAIFHNVHVWRPDTASVPSGSRGLWVRRATDGEYNGVNVVGSDIAIQVDTDSNRFVQCHVWGYSGKLPTKAFYDRANRNSWIVCEADTPATYGWHLEGVSTNIFGGRVLNNSFGPDNVLIGVYSTQATPAQVIIGLDFIGGSSSHRIATDFGGIGGIAGATILGVSSVNVTTVVAARNVMGTLRVTDILNIVSSSTTAFAVGNGTNNTLSVNAASLILSLLNGAAVTGYSGNFSNPTYQLLAATGAIRAGTSAGLGSSTFSGTGVPSSGLGANGDFYNRTDGTAGACIYQKRSGAWVATAA